MGLLNMTMVRFSNYSSGCKTFINQRGTMKLCKLTSPEDQQHLIKQLLQEKKYKHSGRLNFKINILFCGEKS
jgi:hypothetical protein